MMDRLLLEFCIRAGLIGVTTAIVLVALRIWNAAARRMPPGPERCWRCCCSRPGWRWYQRRRYQY
jgi:hypothetical protein